jgi:trimeric autotransporter adhesin
VSPVPISTGEFTGGGSLTGITFSDGVTWNQSQIQDILNNGGGSLGQQGYLFNRGAGQVTLSTSGSEAVNFIQMGAGISSDDLILQADSAGDLTIKFLDSSDSITIQQDLLDLNGFVSSAVSHIEFSDGTSMDLGQAVSGQGAPLTFTWLGTMASWETLMTLPCSKPYRVKLNVSILTSA